MAESINNKFDRVAAEARRAIDEREKGYRAQALKMYPHVCGRCCREFTNKNLQELTVHHRDHDHDNNPPDGSNWELLCVYCHDNEHQKLIEAEKGYSSSESEKDSVTHNPFADLKNMLESKE